MAEGKKSFVLYADQHEIFNNLSKDQKSDLIDTIFLYVKDKNPVVSDPVVNMAFTMIKLQLKRDLEKWDKTLISKSNAGKASAKARELKRQQELTDLTPVEIVEQNQHNATDSTVNDNVNVNGNVIVNDTVNVNDNKSSIEEEIYLKSLKPKIEEKKEIAPTAEIDWNNTTIEEAWNEWIEYKWKVKRFKYKEPKYENMAKNQLLKMSDESEKGAIRIIEHTISNGWSGFVAPKVEKKTATGIDSRKENLEIILNYGND